jgi:hypothetical protein
MTLLRKVMSAITGIIMVLTIAGGAAAQDANTRVIVPDAPGGALIAGCYRVNQRLYGPYRMEFCLQQRGEYTVRGGNVRCEGRLNWSVKGRDINIKLQRTSCGNGKAWSADTITCRGAGLLASFLARIIAPDLPVLRDLRCTYTPAKGSGEDPMSITARRLD